MDPVKGHFRSRIALWIIVMCAAFIVVACSSSEDADTPESAPSETPTELPAPTDAPTATETDVPAEAPTVDPSPEPTQVDTLDRDAACPSEVITAMTEVDTVCSGAERNQICYGNILLEAVPIEADAALGFEAPGDIVDLVAIQQLRLTQNVADNEYGVALMRLQANIDDSLPGQNLTFVLFGDAQLEPDRSGDDEGLQSFFFRSGIGDSPCAEAPESGILVQTPDGVATVDFRINDVDITLGSTAYLQAAAGDDMTVSVIEGQAEVTAFETTEIVVAGSQTQIKLDDEGGAASAPSDAAPYEANLFVKLPVGNLERNIQIAAVAPAGEFTEDAEGWTTVHGGSAVTHTPADESADGYICATDDGDESDIPWYFDAPDDVLIDQSGAYGGELVFALRQSAFDEQQDVNEELVRMRHGDTMVQYFIGEVDHPTTNWTVYRIPLIEGAGWLRDGEAATEADLREVLGALTQLRIRGEFRVGEDTGCLDYIRFVGGLAPIHSGDAAAPIGSFDVFVTTDAMISPGDRVIGVIEEAGETHQYTLSAGAGQQVYFSARGTDGGDIVWTLAAPDGETIFENMGLWIDNDPGLLTLEDEGDYQISVGGAGGQTGEYAFLTWLDSAPQRFELELGVSVANDGLGAASGTIEESGGADIYTFTAPATDTYFFAALGEDGAMRWRLEDEQGELLFADDGLWLGNHAGEMTLAGDVIYTLTVSGADGDTGAYDLMVWRVPDAQTFSYTVGDLVGPDNGVDAQGTLSAPGEVDIYTFSADATDAYEFVALGNESAIHWSLIEDGDTPIFESAGLWLGNNPGEFTLHEGRDYAIIVQGDNGASGAYSWQMWRIPEPDTLDGVTVDTGVFYTSPEQVNGMGDIETPGAVDIYTLTVDTERDVTFRANIGPDEGGIEWSLTSGSGDLVFENEGVWGGNVLGPFTLAPGDYTLVVGGENNSVGQYQFELIGE